MGPQGHPSALLKGIKQALLSRLLIGCRSRADDGHKGFEHRPRVCAHADRLACCPALPEGGRVGAPHRRRPIAQLTMQYNIPRHASETWKDAPLAWCRQLPSAFHSSRPQDRSVQEHGKSARCQLPERGSVSFLRPVAVLHQLGPYSVWYDAIPLLRRDVDGLNCIQSI